MIDYTARMARRKRPEPSEGDAVELRELVERYVRDDEEAWETVHAMVSADPEKCWRFLAAARGAAITDQQLAYISAGPFENLLGAHGADFIDRVEVAARQDPKMRFLIATVWRGSMTPAIWARLEALRARLGIHPL